MFQVDEGSLKFGASIKVIGVGGGGGNAIRTMSKAGLTGVEFIAANTDLQALEEHNIEKKIQLGVQLTKGLGAGANPEIGRQAAIESCNELVGSFNDTDMVFITAGMGGGTGTGATGVIANIAKQAGALTIAVVTRPFFFEGQRRARYADIGIQFLKENVDTLIVIPNQKLMKVTDEQTSLLSAFERVDHVLLRAVKGISDLVNQKGLINLDFADVKTIMSERGLAIIGTGCAEGENRALSAARMAVSSPLLEDTSFKGASGVIINITGGPDMSLKEVNETAEFITAETHSDAEIIFGAIVDPNESSKKIKVTVIATGFEKDKKQNQKLQKNFKGSHSTDSCSADPFSSLSQSGEEEESAFSSSQGSDEENEPAFVPRQVSPSNRLSKDILKEKARSYQNERKSLMKSKIHEQLSMDMLDEQGENLGSSPVKKSLMQESPFQESGKKPLLTELFKKF